MLLKSTATTVNEVSGQVRKVKYLLVKLEKWQQIQKKRKKKGDESQGPLDYFWLQFVITLFRYPFDDGAHTH